MRERKWVSERWHSDIVVFIYTWGWGEGSRTSESVECKDSVSSKALAVVDAILTVNSEDS